MTTAAQILNKAAAHLQDRASTYDRPDGERSMGATVAAFGAITGVTLTAEQGWLFMAVLKAVRSQQGVFKADNYEDGAAYFALACETAAIERGKGAELTAEDICRAFMVPPNLIGKTAPATPSPAPSPNQVRADYPQLAEVADRMTAKAEHSIPKVDNAALIEKLETLKLKQLLGALNKSRWATGGMVPQEPDSDGWIDWKGGDRPVREAQVVDVLLRCGKLLPRNFAGSIAWVYGSEKYDNDIVAYRIAKEQA